MPNSLSLSIETLHMKQAKAFPHSHAAFRPLGPLQPATLLLLNALLLRLASSSPTASTSASSTAAPGCLPSGAAPCALAPNLDQWNTVPGLRGNTRVWDIPALEPAYQHFGSLYHAANLLDKLNSGKGITAAALGSSFVESFAGCWQTSMDAIRSLGVVPNPHVYPQSGPLRLSRTRCKAGGAGYMENFMDTVNRTWPHFDHVFLNLGRGAANLHQLSEASCLSAYLPERLDVVLLDATSVGSPAFAAEKLLRSFLASPSAPLVVLLSNTRNCLRLAPPPAAPLAPEDAMHVCHECLGRINGRPNAEACARLGPEPYTEAGNAEIEENSKPYQTLAVHYDVPHINLHRLLLGSFFGTSGLHRRLNVTKWRLLAKLFRDEVHPPYAAFSDGGAQLLLADVLVNWLLKAQAAVGALTQERRRALRYALPAQVHEQAAHLHLSRCFGISFDQTLGAAREEAEAARKQPGAAEDAAGAFEALDRLSRVRPDSDFFGGLFETGNAEVAQRSVASLPPLHVVRAEGFKVQTYYRSPGSGRLKFKPGYLAATAGASLEFEINTEFRILNTSGLNPDPGATAGPGAVVGSSSPEMQLSYMSSYDSWGIAHVSCASGCSCTPVRIDSSSASKHSLLRTQTLTLTQHPHCRVLVQVLEESSSKGHRFKLCDVMVRIRSTAAHGL